MPVRFSQEPPPPFTLPPYLHEQEQARRSVPLSPQHTSQIVLDIVVATDGTRCIVGRQDQVLWLDRMVQTDRHCTSVFHLNQGYVEETITCTRRGITSTATLSHYFKAPDRQFRRDRPMQLRDNRTDIVLFTPGDQPGTVRYHPRYMLQISADGSPVSNKDYVWLDGGAYLLDNDTAVWYTIHRPEKKKRQTILQQTKKRSQLASQLLRRYPGLQEVVGSAVSVLSASDPVLERRATQSIVQELIPLIHDQQKRQMLALLRQGGADQPRTLRKKVRALLRALIQRGIVPRTSYLTLYIHDVLGFLEERDPGGIPDFQQTIQGMDNLDLLRWLEALATLLLVHDRSLSEKERQELFNLSERLHLFLEDLVKGRQTSIGM